MRFASATLLLLNVLAATFAHSQITQVQHVIVVIQENRTPTNLFHEDAALVQNGAHVMPKNNQATCGIIAQPPQGQSWSCSDVQPAAPVTLTGVSLVTPFSPAHTHYPAWYCTYD